MKIKDTIKSDKQEQRQGWLAELDASQRSHSSANVWQICRKIAGTGLGPKRRQHQVHPRDTPESEQLVQYMAQPGGKGGSDAACIHSDVLDGRKLMSDIMAELKDQSCTDRQKYKHYRQKKFLEPPGSIAAPPVVVEEVPTIDLPVTSEVAIAKKLQMAQLRHRRMKILICFERKHR